MSANTNGATTPQPIHLTYQEAADLLNVGYNTVRRLTRKGGPLAHAVRRLGPQTVRLSRPDVVKWSEAGCPARSGKR